MSASVSNSNGYRLAEEDDHEAYLDNGVPTGFIFKPTDKELIEDYLAKKILGVFLPQSRIKFVNLYQHNPESLVEKYKPANGVKEWYFFTDRERKYQNGRQPSRSAGDGQWKASVGETKIYGGERNRTVIGRKNTLVFYHGRPPNNLKTNWITHEYVAAESITASSTNANSRTTTTNNSMKLDDLVLCRIHLNERNSSSSTRSKGTDNRIKTTSDSISSSSAYPISASPKQQQYHINNITTKTFVGVSSFYQRQQEQKVLKKRYFNEGVIEYGAQKKLERRRQQQQQQQQLVAAETAPHVSSNDQLMIPTDIKNINHYHPVSAYVQYAPQHQQQQQYDHQLSNTKNFIIDRGEFLPATAVCDFISYDEDITDPTMKKNMEKLLVQLLDRLN